jgi:hypothetical protein
VQRARMGIFETVAVVAAIYAALFAERRFARP